MHQGHRDTVHITQSFLRNVVVLRGQARQEGGLRECALKSGARARRGRRRTALSGGPHPHRGRVSLERGVSVAWLHVSVRTLISGGDVEGRIPRFGLASHSDDASIILLHSTKHDRVPMRVFGRGALVGREAAAVVFVGR